MVQRSLLGIGWTLLIGVALLRPPALAAADPAGENAGTAVHRLIAINPRAESKSFAEVLTGGNKKSALRIRVPGKPGPAPFLATTPITALTYTPRGEYLLVGDSSGNLYLLSTTGHEGAPLVKLAVPPPDWKEAGVTDVRSAVVAVAAAAPEPGGSDPSGRSRVAFRLLAAYANGKLAQTQLEIPAGRAGALHATWRLLDVDSATAVALGPNGAVYVLNAAGAVFQVEPMLRRLIQFKPGEVSGLSASQERALLAGGISNAVVQPDGSAYGEMMVYEDPQGPSRKRTEVTLAKAGVDAIQFASDGKQLLYARAGKIGAVPLALVTAAPPAHAIGGQTAAHEGAVTPPKGPNSPGVSRPPSLQTPDAVARRKAVVFGTRREPYQSGVRAPVRSISFAFGSNAPGAGASGAGAYTLFTASEHVLTAWSGLGREEQPERCIGQDPGGLYVVCATGPNSALTVSADGQVRRWISDQGGLKGKMIAKSPQSVYALAWSPRRPDLFVYGGRDKCIHVAHQEPNGGSITQQVSEVFPNTVYALALDEKAELVAAGCLDGSVRVYAVGAGKLVHKRTLQDVSANGSHPMITCVRFITEDLVLWGALDGYLYLGSITNGGVQKLGGAGANGELKPLHPAAQKGIACLDYDRDHRLIVTGGMDDQLRLSHLYLPADGAVEQSMLLPESSTAEANSAGVRAIAFFPGGGRLTIGGANGTVNVWDILGLK